LIYAFVRPYLVFEVDEESAAASDLYIDDRFITSHFPADPIFAAGVIDWKIELAKKQPKAEIPLGVCAKLAHVVIKQPSQHHAMPNLFTGQPHDLKQVEIIGDMFLLLAVAFYDLVVAIQQCMNPMAIIRCLCLC